MRAERTAAFLLATVVGAGCGSENPTTPTVFSVVITAPKQTIAVGEPVQLVTTARDVNGVTIANATFTYVGTPATVVGVNTTGRVIGVGVGAGNIIATSGGLTSLPFAISVVAGSVAKVVTMQANTFTPTQITIDRNQSVLFDFPADPHNVIFQNRTGGPADIPQTMGTQVTRVFATAGTFPYDCTLHPGMSGTVIVNP